MKKFVSGVLVGLFLFAGATTFADSASLIGKKVQGVFSVEKGASKVADAVIIDGSAYAPVRAVADAAGVTLSVEGKRIVMGEKTTTTLSDAKAEALKSYRDFVASTLASKEAAIKSYEGTQSSWETLLKDNPDSASAAKWQEELSREKATLVKLKTEVTELKTKLTEIDAQLTAAGITR